MSYKWNWGIFFQLSPDGTDTYLQLLLFGAGWTLATALLAWVIALSVGSVVGVIRTAPVPWLVRLGNAYVELFRNIPLLVQMFLWYFVLPEVMPQAIGDWLKQSANASFYTAVICLGLYTSARVAEQVKAGIRRLPQRAAHGGSRDGPHAAADLPLRAAADGVPHHPAAADLGIPQHHQELLGGADDRADRAHRRGALDVGILLPGVRGVHGATLIYIVVNIVVVAGMRWLERRVAVPGFISMGPPAAAH